MKKLQLAKIYLVVAALLFVAKPFLGFGLFSKEHPPAKESIFVKVFSKSTPEYSEGNNFSLFEVQKKATTPLPQLFLGISFLLSILFPVLFTAGDKINKRHLRDIRLGVFQPVDTWLLNGHLLI